LEPQERRDLNWDDKRNRNSCGKGIGAFHVERLGCLRPELDEIEDEREQWASESFFFAGMRCFWIIRVTILRRRCARPLNQELLTCPHDPDAMTSTPITPTVLSVSYDSASWSAGARN
jgi:hypothetical protein